MSVILGEHLASARENNLPASIMDDEKAAQYLETLNTAAALGTSMSTRRRAHFETTKRVLAAAVNERLAIGTVDTSANLSLLLRAPTSPGEAGYDDTWIKCGIRANAYFEKDGLRAIGFVRAEDLLNPVLTGNATSEAVEELDPTVLARVICRWNPVLAQNDGGESLIKELQNATDNQIGVPQDPEQPDQIIVPCFTRQLPSIMPFFPEARLLKSVPDCCRAQISMRSISFMPKIGFPDHLKLSLNVQITSGLRNVRPWGAVLGPALGKLLPNLLPPDLWWFAEPASITGAQQDLHKAGQISCVIRQLPEQLAKTPEEVIIPGAGLLQKPFNEDQSYMEILFGLDDLKKKQDWFRKYTMLLFSTVLPPLVRYGIGFESHLQNVAVRVNVTRKEVTGFAVRDFEGTRIHYPTFLRSGYNLSEVPAGSPNLADNLRSPWNKVHHSLIQDHVGPLLHVLDLESQGGWAIVQEELERVLDPSGDPEGKALYDFMTEETMPIPGFMGMRLIGRYVEVSLQ
ncbi:IucC family-domain-containing protein [Penicillium verhagenii]|uniref:IucC family-domain-containing protein n=1 Tax=Penicillium verhagenii TaxID=1562060 RepID=UPI00254562F2|nr:IucC family-domain-containing protein [Penicillium verhagenii]KAJ5920921.1 IucC family-domain-containing protein [Penicillium verhagenii]